MQIPRNLVISISMAVVIACVVTLLWSLGETYGHFFTDWLDR